MADTLANPLVDRIKTGDQEAWQELITRYEGRLTAFVRGRLRDSHIVDDVVQETFLGFLRSLPHYDAGRDLESYLFTIAAHKVRDELRRQGRHPMGLLEDIQRDESTPIEPRAMLRGASSLMASAERMEREGRRLGDALKLMIDQWTRAGDYQRIKCIELLFVMGWSNKEVSAELTLTEQQVANYKFQVVERLGRLINRDA
jgi:RNA polymerase sigma-70 factor (ECF subfamily)